MHVKIQVLPTFGKHLHRSLYAKNERKLRYVTWTCR